MKKKYIVIIISLLIVSAILIGGQIFTVRNISVVFYNKTGLTSESEVIEASGLNSRNNIFSINEKNIKAKISSAYDDNSITVTNIVRSFPNKVTIYVKERIPMFLIKVASEDGNKYVPTDKDFQRGKVTTLDNIDYTLIAVTGFEVAETFDVKECILLRRIANALIAAGLSEEAIPYFISEIAFDGSNVNVIIKESGAIMQFNLDSTADEVKQVYNDYLSLTYEQRNGAVLPQ